jgi:zinc protease
MADRGLAPPPLDAAELDPAGPDPAELDPAGPDPAGPDPAGLDPAGLDPAGLDPAGLDPELLRLPGEPRIERLDNGLTVCLLVNRQAPLVASSLWYRVGARDEEPGQEGVAHFLEHMMFRGSPRYGAGEIDRLTQAWGGTNNAFTSHDATAYHFSFAGERWREALDLEADRMAGLLLDPRAIELERQVILEELTMYEDQPWDALEARVFRRAFGEHPYGRPIVGERSSLAAIGAAELAAFHRRHYRAANAVLVLAGEIGEGAIEDVAESFAALPVRGGGAEASAKRAGRRSASRAPLPPVDPPAGLQRFTEWRGEVDRLFWGLPTPRADSPDEAPLRLLAAILGSGRSSRLHGRLVEEERLCAWVSVDLSETVGPGLAGIAVEALPGADSARIEGEIARQLDLLRREPPLPDELERAQRTLIADRVFGSARIDQQAMLAGHALALFDWELPERQARRLLACSREDLLVAADRYLDPERSSTLGSFSPPVHG